MEEIRNLPQDILPGNDFFPGEVIIHDYTADADVLKGRSILHTHAISLVISGEKIMHFAEKTVVANNSEFHFLSAGNCLASIVLAKQNIFRSILIFFDDEVLGDFYNKYADRVKVGPTFDEKHQPYISILKDEFTRNYITSLEIILNQNTVLSKQMKQVKFEELMLYLLEAHPEKILSFKPYRKNSSDDMELKRIIESNILNNLTLDELAFLCNVSLSTFKRRFLKVYGMAPNKWFIQRRMELAANLLTNHNEPPSEVFHKVGYENHSSFSQSFKQVFGKTPRDYQSERLAD